MELTVEHSADIAIVRIGEARLTYPVLAPFLAAVRQLVEQGGTKILVDLSAVTYLDSASIGCLMDIYRLLREQTGELKLCGLTPRVETMISMTGMHRLIDIHRDEKEALAAFGSPRAERG
jgi:anti-anti-sigma factor